MVKPSQPSSPATSRQPKRRKVIANQTKLDAFFSSPSQSSPKKDRDDKESWVQETSNSPLALKSAEDGLHLETMQTLETRWHENKLQSNVSPNDTDENAVPEDSHPRNACQISISSQPSNLRANRFTDVSSSGKMVDPKVFAVGDTGPPDYQPLSQDPLTFDIEHQPWPAGSPAPYSFLSHTLSELSNTRSRIAITNALTNCLRTIVCFHSPSLLPALYLLSNMLAPPYASVELGLGSSVISKAIQHVSGISPQGLKRLYITTGDIGDVAYQAKSSLRTLVPHAPLIIAAVYDSLLKIANAKGPGAAKRKQAIVEKLLVAAKGEEVRFLVRTLSQNLRVGAVRTTLLSALARAMVLSLPSPAAQTDSIYHSHLPGSQGRFLDGVRDELIHMFGRAEALTKSVYVRHPNYDDIVRVLLESGLDGLREGAPLTVGGYHSTGFVRICHKNDTGIPLLPTLGSPVRSVDDIYECLGDLQFSAEFKYDGQRAQIHARREGDGEVLVKIFSRHLEDMTTKASSCPQVSHEIIRSSTILVSRYRGNGQ
jgi:DNA ligase-1